MSRPPMFAFGGEDMPQTAEELRRLREQLDAFYRPRVPQNVGEGLVALGEGLATGIQKWRAGSRLQAGKDFAQGEANWMTKLLRDLGGGAGSPQPGIMPSSEAPAPQQTAGLFSLPNIGGTQTDAPRPAPVMPDGPIQLSDIAPRPDDRSIPAAIRHNNPGAMWPGPSSKRFGATGFQMLNDGLGQGNRIATFPTPEQGGAALFDLLDRRYTGKTLTDAIRKWSGGNHSDAYAARVARATGLTPDTVLTPDMLRDPTTALALANAMAGHEAGRPFPMPEGGWNRAHALFLAGGMDAAGQGLPQQQPPQGAPLPAPVTSAPLPPLPQAPPQRPDMGDDLARRFLNGGAVPRTMGATAARIAAGNQMTPNAAAPVMPEPAGVDARVNDAFSIPEINQYAPRANPQMAPPQMAPVPQPVPRPAMPVAAPPPSPTAGAGGLPAIPRIGAAPPPQQAPQAPPADPAATAFLTGQQPQAPAPVAMPRMPDIPMPKVASGVPQVTVPQPRLSPEDLARASALVNNPLVPPAARMQAQMLLQEEMKRRDPAYARQFQQQAMEMELKRRELAGEVSPLEAAKFQLDMYRQQIEAAKADPNYMSAADRARIENDQKRLELEVKRADPSYMTGAERARIELDRQKFDFDRNKAPTQDIAEYEYARRQGYMGSLAEFMAEQKRAGATTINNTGERAFEKETGTALAKRFDALATDGDQAANDLQVLGSLREQLTKVPTGFTAVMQQWAGSIGIKTEGSSAVETVHALVSRLTPAQRVPGSGATSDFDAKMFRDSLPSLMNTPEGNLKIMEVMEGLAQNRLARADIATRVQIGEITPKDALAELRALQAQARALSDQFKPADQRKGGLPAPAAPQGGGEVPADILDIMRKYGQGGQ